MKGERRGSWLLRLWGGRREMGGAVWEEDEGRRSAERRRDRTEMEEEGQDWRRVRVRTSAVQTPRQGPEGWPRPTFVPPFISLWLSSTKAFWRIPNFYQPNLSSPSHINRSTVKHNINVTFQSKWFTICTLANV